MSVFSQHIRYLVYRATKQAGWEATLSIALAVQLVLPDPNGIYAKENEDTVGNIKNVVFNSKLVHIPLNDCWDPSAEQFLDPNKRIWLSFSANSSRSTILMVTNPSSQKQ